MKPTEHTAKYKVEDKVRVTPKKIGKLWPIYVNENEGDDTIKLYSVRKLSIDPEYKYEGVMKNGYNWEAWESELSPLPTEPEHKAKYKFTATFTQMLKEAKLSQERFVELFNAFKTAHDLKSEYLFPTEPEQPDSGEITKDVPIDGDSEAWGESCNCLSCEAEKKGIPHLSNSAMNNHLSSINSDVRPTYILGDNQHDSETWEEKYDEDVYTYNRSVLQGVNGISTKMMQKQKDFIRTLLANERERAVGILTKLAKEIKTGSNFQDGRYSGVQDAIQAIRGKKP